MAGHIPIFCGTSKCTFDLTKLKPKTEYSVLVHSFNEIGDGLSDSKSQYTADDVKNQPS